MRLKELWAIRVIAAVCLLWSGVLVADDGPLAEASDQKQIQVVEAGLDATGCTVYRAVSPSGSYSSMLLYRSASGHYVMTWENSACASKYTTRSQR